MDQGQTALSQLGLTGGFLDQSDNSLLLFLPL